MLLSLGWLARFATTDAPGPVTHADALCQHDAVDAFKADRSVEATHDCFVTVPRSVWVDLTTRFQQVAEVAAPLTRLRECSQCHMIHQQEREALQAERDEISKLDSTKLEAGQIWFIVDAGWLKHWREYCWDASRTDPPGPVCNWRLLAGQQPRYVLSHISHISHRSSYTLRERSYLTARFCVPGAGPTLFARGTIAASTTLCGASLCSATGAIRRFAASSSMCTPRPPPPHRARDWHVTRSRRADF